MAAGCHLPMAEAQEFRIWRDRKPTGFGRHIAQEPCPRPIPSEEGHCVGITKPWRWNEGWEVGIRSHVNDLGAQNNEIQGRIFLNTALVTSSMSPPICMLSIRLISRHIAIAISNSSREYGICFGFALE